MNKSFTLTFNINDQGRTTSGNFRRYRHDNVRQVLESAATRERIRLREATGYIGHGRRQMTGKLNLGEIETVNTPSGPIILENVPACVTTALSMDDDGTIHHTQEVLGTDPGKAVLAMIESKVGGFSWAAGGKDGRSTGLTTINSFYGFDYVTQPNYSANRSYQILESAGEMQEERDQILEAMRSCGLSEEKALMYANTFTSPYLMAADMEAEQDALLEAVQARDSRIQELETELAGLSDAGANRERMMREWANDYHIAVPRHVFESIRQGDFAAERMFFESVAKCERTTATELPLDITSTEPRYVRRSTIQAAPDYGSASAAPDFG